MDLSLQLSTKWDWLAQMQCWISQERCSKTNTIWEQDLSPLLKIKISKSHIWTKLFLKIAIVQKEQQFILRKEELLYVEIVLSLWMIMNGPIKQN